MERRLAAILAADVVGYSRLMQLAEVRTLSALKATRNDILQPLLAKHHGRVVNFVGDGVLAEFASAVHAVECAAELQPAMDAANVDVPEDQKIVLRVGINLGDVIVEGTEVFGDGVNIAARLQALAEPGGILISETVFSHVRGKVQIEFEDFGEHRLKNMPQQVRIFRALGTALALPRKAILSKPSIAVLPFENMGGDPESLVFADGLAEDIITELSRAKSLAVIARNSSFTYKGRSVSVKDIARELGIQYLLEGSVRKAGEQIRVSAQLVEGDTGAHIWAEHFDRSLGNPFALQQEIACTIVATMQQQLYLSEGRAGVERRDRSNTELEHLLQRSWARVHDLTQEAVAEARELAERALAIDPDNARSNFLVGCALFQEASMMFRSDDASAMLRARQLVERSIVLDDNDEHAHWILGNILWASGQIEPAIAEQERALDINPNWSLALADLGEALCYAGRPEEGLPKVEQAIRLNPRDPAIFFRFTTMAAGNYIAGNYVTAEQWARKTVQRRRQYFFGYVFLTASLVRIGRLPEAAIAAQELLLRVPDFKISRLQKFAFRPADFERLSADLRAAGLNTD
jgi:adenylate cyclase